MKFEKLSKNNGNKKFVYGFVICAALFITINLLTSKSKFKAEDNVDLAEGTINYVIPDLKLMAVYVKNEEGTFEKKDTVPSDTIYQVVKDNTDNSSYCADSAGNKLDNVYMKYENGTIDIKVTKKGTKCWVYLEKAKVLKDAILPSGEALKNITEKSEFTATATTNEGMFKILDYDNDYSYYFRGAVTNNYVHFADFYWRIIRINSDGSIRMIYDGTIAHTNGDDGNGVDRQIEEKGTAFNTNYNDAKYVGFKYGGTDPKAASTSYEEATTNTHNSTILTKLEEWYENNLTKYDNYLEKDAIFCNDRRSANNRATAWTDWLANPEKQNFESGYGKTVTAYGAYLRSYSSEKGFLKTQYADLSCQPNDRFTPTTATIGNKSMKYPIGLITFDEVLMGGGFHGKANNQYYLATGKYFWTMTPNHFDTNNGHARLFFVDGTEDITATVKYLFNHWSAQPGGVRPVINLKANTTFINGNGTINSPYEIM